MEENEIEKAEPNRNRSRQVKFWVSKEEYELLQKKRELGIKPLRAVPKMVLQDFPTIPFFELESEEEVLKQIEEWGKEGKLGKKLEEIEDTLKTNSAYNSMRAWCIDFTYTSSKLIYDENMRRVAQSANNRSLPNRDLIYG